MKKILIVFILAVFTMMILSTCELSMQDYKDFCTCGFDEGPFTANVITITKDKLGTDSTLIDEGILIINNPVDSSLAPVLSLVEKGEITWSIDMNFDPDYDWPQSGMHIHKVRRDSRRKITFVFYGYQEGAEMKIDRKTGENQICTYW